MTGPDAPAPPSGPWAVLSDLDGATLATRAAAARAAGAAALTVRRPRPPLAAVLAALRAAPGFRAVHADPALAAAAGADAVIAGVRSLPTEVLVRCFPELVVGASVHDLDEARRARDAGARFLLFGPVWDTPEKRGFLAPRGPAALAEAVALGLPVVAIGGVDRPERVAAVAAAGGHGFAALRAAADPARFAALAAAWPGGLAAGRR